MDTTKLPKLQGSSNYDIWSIRMEALLVEKGYYDVMTTETSNLDLDLEENKILKEKASKATAYIRLTLGDGPLLQTRYITDPNILWSSLKNLYEAKGFSSEFLSIKELLNTTLSSSKDNMELYLHNIRRIINTLESKSIKLPERFIIGLILNNLSRDYEYTVAIISQTIRSNNTINIDDIFSQLLDESKRLKGNKASNRYPSIDNTKDKDIEMSLNTKDKKKSNRKPYNNNNRGNIECSFCHKKGHLEEKCWSKYPNKKSSNNTTNSTPNDNLCTITNKVLNTTKDTSKSTKIEWILDSGATIHTCTNREAFSTFSTNTNISIKWGNTTNSIKASGIGNIEVLNPFTKNSLTINNVIYCPELGVNLLSLGLIVEKGNTFTFKGNKASILNPRGTLLLTGDIRDKLIYISTNIKSNTTKNINSSDTKQKESINSSISIDLWHERLGHISNKALLKLKDNTLGNAITNNKESTSIENCETCIKAKMTSKISREPSPRSTKYLAKIHVDIGGPISPRTKGGFKYYITFLDDFSKELQVKLLRNRKGLYKVLKELIELSENQADTKVKRIHADNEFKSKEIETLFTNKGILITYSSPYSHEQNGGAERINRTLFNKVRALLIASNLPKFLWGEALLATVYIYNRTPNSSIDYKTPYELKTGTKPDISNIRTWGSLTYKKEPKELLSKLDNRASPYYLIGYGSNQYKLLDISNYTTVYARDVKILEGNFYNKDDPNTEVLEIIEKEDLEDLETNNNKTKELETDSPNLIDYNKVPRERAPSPQVVIESKKQYINSSKNLEDLNLDYSYEEKRDPNSLDYKEVYNQLLEEALISRGEEPNSFKDVLSLESPEKENYLEAMKVEVSTLNKLNTWKLVPRPNNPKLVLKGRWVLTKKFKANGTLDKYKARWVVKGFLQVYGVNYNETFASTSKPNTIRLLLYIATNLGWEIYSWDIKSAFPNAPIDSTIYVEQPIGFIDKNKPSNYVCLLNKALYGLKQSARQWQLYLATILAKFGFINLVTDTAVFYSKDKPIILVIHVDDILVFAEKKSYIDELYKDLSATNLEVSNLGELKEFLGIQINRNKDKKELVISQEGYITKILNRFEKSSLKPKVNPLTLGIKLDKNLDQASSNDISRYQQEIGSLIYLTTFTRPDLAFPINYLARFMSNPSSEHFKALDVVWSYLVKTKDLGIIISGQSCSNTPLNSSNLIGYVDADWGGDLVTRRSTTGYVYLVNKVPISWFSKLQKTPAISSCEAEYMAYKEAIKENLFINNFLNELPNYVSKLFKNRKTLFTDSLSAIELSKNPLYHARSKHIDITYHFSRDKVLNKEIYLEYIPTEEMLADGLTKGLSNPKFQKLVEGLGLKKTN